jgi:hypothetical protein
MLIILSSGKTKNIKKKEHQDKIKGRAKAYWHSKA